MIKNTQTNDLEISFSYNIWDFYQNHLIGVDIPIEEKNNNQFKLL